MDPSTPEAITLANRGALDGEVNYSRLITGRLQKNYANNDNQVYLHNDQQFFASRCAVVITMQFPVKLDSIFKNLYLYMYVEYQENYVISVNSLKI